jgi:PAS domain S-box-containing protein
MEKAAQQHIKFWNYLTEDLNELGKLSELGSAINATLALVEEHWDKMQRYKQNSAKVVRQYATFLRQILNDKEGGMELMKSISEGKVVREEVVQMDKAGEFQEVAKFTEGGYGVIVAAGDSNIGKINLVSMGVCSLFGYSKAELIGQDTDLLVPRLFADYHRELMGKAANKGEDKPAFKERYVYARHKTGYIFTMDKQIKALPSIVNSWQFVVCVRKDKKKVDTQTGIILFTRAMLFTDISSRTKPTYPRS